MRVVQQLDRMSRGQLSSSPLLSEGLSGSIVLQRRGRDRKDTSRERLSMLMVRGNDLKLQPIRPQSFTLGWSEFLKLSPEFQIKRTVGQLQEALSYLGFFVFLSVAPFVPAPATRWVNEIMPEAWYRSSTRGEYTWAKNRRDHGYVHLGRP